MPSSAAISAKWHNASLLAGQRAVFTAAFLAVIAVFGLSLATKALRAPASACALAENFPYKRWFVELNGGAHLVVGRKFCNTVYRAPRGMLLTESMGKGRIEPIADAVADFSRWLAGKQVPFVYVQTPLKIDMEGTMLPAPLVNNGNARADSMMALLAEKGVNAVDLRAMLTATPGDLERFFYRTDHHRNNDAAFKVFSMLAPEIAGAVGDDPSLVAPYVDMASWKRTVWSRCFVGTRSRRTGLLFGGKDDLAVYAPRFKTEMAMDIISRGISLSGDFHKTVMWHSNKIWKGGSDGFGRDAYSLLYIGGIYGVVKHANPGAPLKRRILLVGDSYTRPFEAFLSTVVSDLVVLDQRRLAPGETVAGFVESFKPDFVLQMNNPAALVAGTLPGLETHLSVLFTYGKLE